MAITKINSVRKLNESINYILQDTKTKDNLITTFKCDKDFVYEDFYEIYKRRKNVLRKDTRNKAKMIIQSFDDNITAEEAHEVGVQFAKEYLNNNHQFIVVTHIDTEHIHNHIIFNLVKLDNYLLFDTSRKNTIDNLRKINDKICFEHNLKIENEEDNKHINYISQREVMARKKKISFKEKLENIIDETINESNSYDEFLQKMKDKGYDYRDQKYLSFKNEKSNKYMRTETLGINYFKKSIQYRIENKDFKIYKFDYTLKNKKINLNQEKFKNNYGLRKWAVKQNLSYLQEISTLVINEKKTLKEIENINIKEESFVTNSINELRKLDDIIYEIEKKQNAFKDYKDSYNLIMEYKNSEDKKKFKSEHYSEFKKYDNANKNIYFLKKMYNIKNKKELQEYLNAVKSDRNNLYNIISELTKQENMKNIRR